MLIKKIPDTSTFIEILEVDRLKKVNSNARREKHQIKPCG